MHPQQQRKIAQPHIIAHPNFGLADALAVDKRTIFGAQIFDQKPPRIQRCNPRMVPRNLPIGHHNGIAIRPPNGVAL
jgi:hypothetical protein